MATVTENREFYKDYDWSSGGEEWADAWGGSDMQWYGSILPRIHLFLPAKNIVEIGSGYGRWANYFLPQCEKLTLIDLNRECVDACSERFAKNPKITCVQNEGCSLDFIDDKSIDLFFSFHSLVHADDETMKEYVGEISNKLTRNGVAFLHHSNAKAYVNDVKIVIELLTDYRDITMSAEKMKQFADDAGLRCSTQELINWETEELLDCFSVLAHRNSLWGRTEKTIVNDQFMGEMAHFGRLAEIYGQGQTPSSTPYCYKFSGKN